MDLVGRQVELAAISRALDEVRDGGSHVIAVLGEAGIGKSALLDAIAGRAGGLTVAAGRAAEHERDLPFALASAVLEPHVSTVGRDRTLALANRYGVAYTPARRARFPSAPTPRSATGSIASSARSSSSSDRSRCCSTTSSGPTTRRSSCSCICSPAGPRSRTCSSSRCGRRRSRRRCWTRRGAARASSSSRWDRWTTTHLALFGDVGDRERLVRAAGGLPLYLSELARSGRGLGA